MTSSFSLIKEMHDTPNILRQFDNGILSAWRTTIEKKGRLFLTGEGSSRILPAKNLIAQALHYNTQWHIHTEGARQACSYDLNDYTVIASSNSGQTREVIDLFSSLKEKNIPRFAITATTGSTLTSLATGCHILSCGKEQATAATKSVVEQALLLHSLLPHSDWSQQQQAADVCDALLSTTLPTAIVDILSSATMVYFAGRNDGVAEELTLKTNEIIRKKACFLEGTYVVHGVEEVMDQQDVLVLIEPFKNEIEKVESVIGKAVGVSILAIASYDTPFPTIKIPNLKPFDSYFQLMAGWNLLKQTGLNLGINLDKPIRARKIGNAF